MKKFVATAAVLMVAGAAVAQPANPNAYRLDLQFVLRSVSGQNLTDVQTGGSVNATVGTTYRVELRYRINDGDLTDNIGSRGLTSANIIITGGTVTKGLLSPDQGARSVIGTPNSAAPANPDTTATANGVTLGLTELGGGTVSGMMDPFRGGVGANNNAPANGTAVPAGWSILPLSLSAPGQNSFTGLVANNNNNTISWGLYAFDFVYTGGAVTIGADAAADPQTQNKFAFWFGGTTPAQSQTSTAASITFIPAPGAAALLGLGGLVAARRRRA